MTLLVNSKSGERHYQNEVFPLSVGNIDYLSCLGKLEHPYESRISQQSHKSAPTGIGIIFLNLIIVVALGTGTIA